MRDCGDSLPNEAPLMGYLPLVSAGLFFVVEVIDSRPISLMSLSIESGVDTFPLEALGELSRCLHSVDFGTASSDRLEDLVIL